MGCVQIMVTQTKKRSIMKEIEQNGEVLLKTVLIQNILCGDYFRIARDEEKAQFEIFHKEDFKRFLLPVPGFNC